MPRILSRNNLAPRRGSCGGSLSNISSSNSLSSSRRKDSSMKPSDKAGALRRPSMKLPRDNNNSNSKPNRKAIGGYSMPALTESQKASYMTGNTSANEEWGFFVTGSTSTNNLSALGASMCTVPAHHNTSLYRPGVAPVVHHQKPRISMPSH